MRDTGGTGIVRLLRDPKAILGVLISTGGIYWAFKDFHFFDFKESMKTVAKTK